MPGNFDHTPENKAGSGRRTAHNQMERNFHEERDPSVRKGESTTPPKKH